MSSYRPSGEKKLTIINWSGVRFRIVIPWFCTWVGSIGIASATRFCTITSAALTSVPMSKVTERVYEPSLPICDDM